MTLATSGISVGNDILSFTRSGNRTASASTSAGGFSGSYAYDLAGRMTTDGLRAHEIGHTLGMSHDYYGIMSESQDQHRTNEVTSKQDILTSIINIISKVYEQKK